MRLRDLLIISFLLVSTIPLFASIELLTHQARAQGRDQIAEQLRVMSLINRERVREACDRIQDSAALIASRTQMRISLRRYTESGDADELGRIRQTIRDAAQAIDRVRGIDLYDLAGTLVASAGPEADLERRQGSSGQVGDIVLVRRHDELLLVWSSDLSLDGESVGLLRVVFAADFLIDLVKNRAGLGETGEWLFAVRDEQGDALFVVPLLHDPDAAFVRRVSRNRVDVPITQALLGKDMLMQNAPDYAGRSVLAYTRYIPEHDWGLVAKIDEQEVEDRVLGATRWLQYFQISIVLLSVALITVLFRMVAVPLGRLKRQTEKITRGEFDVREVSSGFREVRELSADFQVMAQTLKELDAVLQRQARGLERSNQELDDFAHIVSHDLKEPLRGIQNLVSFVQEDNADKLEAEGQEMLDQLSNLAGQLTTLISDLLTFSRYSRLDGAVGQVGLDEVVDTVLDTLTFSLEERNVQLIRSSKLPTVECDASRVGEIFRNLITNAVKYTDRKGATLEIGCEEGSPPVFFVRDNGIGIAEKDASRVFQIFTRLHHRDAYGGGTGAGLAISRKVVEAHGGRIWFKSLPGEGTTFYFTLAPEA